jgi:signal peptidase I
MDNASVIEGASTPQTAETAGKKEAPEPPRDPPQQPQQPKKRPKRGSKGSGWREIPRLILFAFIIALLLRSFVVQAFWIPSESMEPTLRPGDRVLVNRNAYRFHPPRRGDIIVFSDPHPEPSHRNPVSAAWHWLVEGLGIERDPNKDFIKRVIGLPGETVELKRGVVFIDGKALQNEPYLSRVKEHRDWGPERVPKRRVFVLGDNRTQSGDSRYGLGMIPLDKIIGRAFIVLWPPGHWGWLSDKPIPP